MSADNLDQMTDAAISETFALEVAGWEKEKEGEWFWTAEGDLREAPYFATSADDVTPYVEKEPRAHIEWNSAGSYWFVQLHPSHCATDRMYARAIAKAVIRYARAKRAAAAERSVSAGGEGNP